MLATINNPYLDELKTIPIQTDGFGSGKYARSSFELTWKLPSYKRGPYVEYRDRFVVEYSWAIPCHDALLTISNFTKNICEIGAGTGYWAYMLSQYGVNVVAYDIKVPGKDKNSYRHAKTWFPVQGGDILSITQHQHRTLMLCWPPYDSPMALRAAQLYTGDKIVYIGEGYGGCTGSDEFHDYLSNNFTLVEEYRLKQWSGIHDRLYLYRRNNVSNRRRSDGTTDADHAKTGAYTQCDDV